MSISVNGKTVEYKEGLRILDLVEGGNKSVIAGKIGNKLRDLDYKVPDGSDIVLHGLEDYDCMRLYEASLRFLFLMACKRALPSLSVKCDYFIFIRIFICAILSCGFYSTFICLCSRI